MESEAAESPPFPPLLGQSVCGGRWWQTRMKCRVKRGHRRNPRERLLYHLDGGQRLGLMKWREGGEFTKPSMTSSSITTGPVKEVPPWTMR